jgi:hypothetical protein
MNELAQQFGFSFLNESWLPQLLTLIGAVIVINIGAYYLLRHIEKIAARTASVWDDALIKAIRKPLTLTLWVAGLRNAIAVSKACDTFAVQWMILPPFWRHFPGGSSRHAAASQQWRGPWPPALPMQGSPAILPASIDSFICPLLP